MATETFTHLLDMPRRFQVPAPIALHHLLAIGEALAHSFPWCVEWEGSLKRLFASYVKAKQTQAVLDYDDLLLYWARMTQVEALASIVSSRFDHVLVDEYQDTNALQPAILLGLKPGGAGLTVVGDDAQAIYSFRSATVATSWILPAASFPRRR